MNSINMIKAHNLLKINAANHSITFPTLIELPTRKEFKDLLGTHGSNREITKPCQIRASNDIEAIQCWLSEYEGSPQTYRSYQKEAERLLLWCIFQRKKSLSSLDRADLEAYFEFICDPQPANVWCGPKGGRGKHRGSASWKPFVKGLGPLSRSTTITIIDSLISYLFDAQYLAFNPLSLKRKRFRQQVVMATQAIKSMRRVLEPDEWHVFLDTIEALPEDTPHTCDEKERTRFIVNILYFLLLRVHELEKHPWNSFIQLYNLWWFCVIGKGGKLALIPVHSDLVASIQRFRTYCKKSPFPSTEDDSPIIPSWRSQKALGTRQINNILKRIAYQTAEHFKDDKEKYERIRRLSSHWMRHQASSSLGYKNVNIEKIADLLRHENVDTSRTYVHTFYNDLHKTMQNLSLRVDLPDKPSTNIENLVKELIEKIATDIKVKES